MKSLFIFFGLTVFAAIGYVLGYLAFTSYPQVYDIFSVAWTVVIGILLFQMLRFIWKPSSAATAADRRREIYSLVLSLCEMVSFSILIFLAIIFSTVSTTPGNDRFLSMIIAFGVITIGALVGTRTVRAYSNHRLAQQTN